MQKKLFSLLLSFVLLHISYAQSYNIVIKGGHVIDPKNNIDGIMDVAISDGKIAAVAKNIDPKGATQVVDAKGLYVTPGLIDIHGHVFYGTEANHYLSNGMTAVVPDGFTFRVGVTTIVDAGGAGWKSFETFKKNIIDNSQTRVLAFLNIVGEGMRGGPYEQNPGDMDPKMAALVARRYNNLVVGFKLAHYQGHEWSPTDNVVEAGKLADKPVMIDFGGSNPPLSIEELFLKKLRPGDIFTHTFGHLETGELGPNAIGRETIVDINTKKLKPFVKEAQKRGIVFDVGYGGASFTYSQAIPATQEGFFPNTISTDLHIGSMNAAMKDQLNCMTKFLLLGMKLQDVIKASTWTPAQVIKHEELGHLSVGAIADVTVLNLRPGKYGLFDYKGQKVEGDKKFECELTIKDGKIVYDLNAIATPVVLK
ncbi:MAG: amidohydrolase/deacetylase family metallohydrolase [Chitinophagaceae bacterium]|nr:MAG: amidohydrolase/deacetylase family metallohydrolase [Chitinophagaceae bacterium]